MKANLEIVTLVNDVVTESIACAKPSVPAKFGGNGANPCGGGVIS